MIKHQCTEDCHTCLNCGAKTFMPSHTSRPKKFCDNRCQHSYNKANGISIRVIPEDVTRERMEQMYLVEGKSTRVIGLEIGKNQVQVARYLRKFGIPTRAFSTKGLQTALGRKHTPEAKEKLRQYRLGRRIPPEVRMKMGSKGSKNPGYIDGRTPANKRARHSAEYSLWREAVFTRDNYTCQACGKRGGDINADHIKPFALYPELRTSIENGRTLCIPCHRKTDTFGNGSKSK